MVLLGTGVVFAGVAWPLCTLLISNRASNKMQGKIMGMSQSMLSLAMGTSPLLGGLVDHLFGGAPFLLAAFANLLAALVYLRIKK